MKFLSCWNVDCLWTDFTIQKFVHNADIGKRSSRHYLIIASATPIGIEIFAFHPNLKEILCSGAVPVDVPTWRNMVRGYYCDRGLANNRLPLRLDDLAGPCSCP